ncbi:SDR family oxidoreductase [Paenibacillus sp. GCM10023250]|uniref:SDR family oxidoreductase n=1 Tax=Paenibacillus sp. GCM10023250 TaxID=3252648 RepID=UPI0036122248
MDESAIEILTKYWAKEPGGRGIRVNSVAPGAIMTDIAGGTLRNNPGSSGTNPLRYGARQSRVSRRYRRRRRRTLLAGMGGVNAKESRHRAACFCKRHTTAVARKSDSMANRSFLHL